MALLVTYQDLHAFCPCPRHSSLRPHHPLSCEGPYPCSPALLPSHTRLLLQLPNRLTSLCLPRPRRIHFLPCLPRHSSYIPCLPSRRFVVPRSPSIRILNRLARLCVLIFCLCVLQFVNFLGGFAFVEGGGINVRGAFLRGEGGEEGFLF